MFSLLTKNQKILLFFLIYFVSPFFMNSLRFEYNITRIVKTENGRKSLHNRIKGVYHELGSLNLKVGNLKFM